MNSDLRKVYQYHLEQVVGLCGITRDSWTSQDRETWQAARDFVQLHKESTSEDQGEKVSSELVGKPSEE